jgi:hypothetical protein
MPKDLIPLLLLFMVEDIYNNRLVTLLLKLKRLLMQLLQDRISE